MEYQRKGRDCMRESLGEHYPHWAHIISLIALPERIYVHRSHGRAASRIFKKRKAGKNWLPVNVYSWIYILVSCQTHLVMWSRLSKSSYHHVQQAAVINLLGAVCLFIFIPHFINKTYIMDGPIWFGDLKWYILISQLQEHEIEFWNWDYSACNSPAISKHIRKENIFTLLKHVYSDDIASLMLPNRTWTRPEKSKTYCSCRVYYILI